MKKAYIIILGIILIISYLIIKPIRTTSTMEDIARDELENTLFEQFGKTNYQKVLKKLKGPIILEKEFNGYVEFIWETTAINGEKACIYIDVYKNPFSFSRVTMDANWQYVTSSK